MNVQAGDLAIIKCDVSRYNGRIVQVLYAAPHGSSKLPDGYPATTEGYPDLQWVIKFVGGPNWTSLTDGSQRLADYAMAEDSYLRPLPGDPIEERETDEVAA